MLDWVENSLMKRALGIDVFDEASSSSRYSVLLKI